MTTTDPIVAHEEHDFTITMTAEGLIISQCLIGGEIDLDSLRVSIGGTWQAKLVADLPRCPHGRIDGDTCSGWTGPRPFDGGCYGGVSVGNPKMPSGQVFAYGLSAQNNWVMPPRDSRSDPAAWRTQQ